MDHQRVDMVRAQPLQGAFDIFPDRFCPVIPVDRIPVPHILELAAFIAPVQAALGLQDKAVPPALQGLTQYGFTVADAVDRGCINVVDAQLISVIQQVLHHLHVHRHIRPDVAGPEAPCPEGYL